MSTKLMRINIELPQLRSKDIEIMRELIANSIAATLNCFAISGQIGIDVGIKNEAAEAEADKLRGFEGVFVIDDLEN